MVYAARGGFWLVIAKGVALSTSLLLAISMANLISPEVFGSYKFVLSATGIFGAFTLTGASTAMIQSVARGYEGAFRVCTREYLKWSIGSVGIALAAAGYYFINGNNVLALSFLIVAIGNPILVSSSFFSQFISAKKDFKTGSIFDSIADVVPVISLIAATFLTKNPSLLIATYFFSGIAVNIILREETLRKFRPNDRIDPETSSYARHLSAMGIIGKIGENIDKILVYHYLGAASLAVYAFAQTPIAQLKLLNDIPAQLAFPKLSERSLPELQKTLPRKIFMLMGIILVIVCTYIFAAPFLFSLLFPKYVEGVIFTQVLALSLVFAPGSLFSAALTAHMKRKELYISQSVLPLIKIGLFIVLLPLFGIWGAVITILTSQCIMFLLYGYLFLGATHAHSQ